MSKVSASNWTLTFQKLKFSKYVEISYTFYTTRLNGKWATRPRFARHAPQLCNAKAKFTFLG